MFSRHHILATGSLVLWIGAVAFTNTGAEELAPQKSTTNSGIYTKAQADGAKKQFDTLCAGCHPFSEAAKKKPSDMPLGGDPFFETWTGRPLSEMISLIALTMPNDGSATVTDAEAADLVAYVLQQNGYPVGTKPLTKDSASAVIERPKK